MTLVNSIVKNFALPIKWTLYHKRHKKEANAVLKSIESEKGRTDKKFIKLSDEYASEVLGWSGYAPWLYVYCAISENFKEGWVPDSYYGEIVVPKLKGDYGEISFLKPLTNRLFRSKLFPDIAYFVNGLFLSEDYQVLKESDVKKHLFRNSEKVVLKLDNSRQGQGVFFFTKSSFDLEKVRDLGNGVFQYYIEQHAFFEQFTPKSVATLRITTVIDAVGTPSLRACYLRLGQGDDTHIKSISHVRVPINIENGGLATVGYLPNWLRTDTHPGSKVPFENLSIPSFEGCIAEVLNLHRAMPYVRSVGWDVIVDKANKIQVMEWNGNHNDIKFSEATQGPCFADLGWEMLWKGE